ncbi:MAG: hypothetical protein IKU54_04030 [Oscillospiraceae bacterium]|nr:hypothetical protein [Oscillospiraceae bacterium]
MSKAIIVSFLALVFGYIGTGYGDSYLNCPELGPIIAIVIIGFAIITSIENLNR